MTQLANIWVANKLHRQGRSCICQVLGTVRELELNRDPFLELSSRVVRMEDSASSRYFAQPDGSHVLYEYRSALSAVCISPELMSSSGLQTKLHVLRQLRSAADERYTDTVANLVMKAFSLHSSDSAVNFRGRAVGDDSFGGNYFASAVQFYQQLGWERPFLQAALSNLRDTEDATGLQILLGLMQRAVGECSARKRSTFATIINWVKLPSDASRSAASTAGDKVTAGMARLKAAAVAAVDDIKERAIQTVFLQPSLAFFRLSGDATMEGDVEVHGTNTYAGLLRATVGIKLNRMPLWEDDCKGIVDVAGLAGFEGFSEQDLHQQHAHDQRGSGSGASASSSSASASSTSMSSSSSRAPSFSASAAAPELQQIIASLWADDNFGKHAAGIREINRAVQRPRYDLQYKSARYGTSSSASSSSSYSSFGSGRADGAGGCGSSGDGRSFIWGDQTSVRSICDCAVVDDPSNSEQRSAFAKYLDQYCHYFSESFILQRLFTSLSTDDGLLDDLQFFAARTGLIRSSGSGSTNPHADSEMDDGAATAADAHRGRDDLPSDIRHAVWDLDADPPTFNTAVARALFAALGVCKQPGEDSRLVPYSPPPSLPAHSPASAGGQEDGHAAPIATSITVRIPSTDIVLTAAGDIRGGGTGREFVTNLLEDGAQGWNKWCHPGYVRSSWVQADFVDPAAAASSSPASGGAGAHSHQRHVETQRPLLRGPRGQYHRGGMPGGAAGAAASSSQQQRPPSKSYAIASYGMCSANDCPHRDPSSWVLRGKAAASDEWIELHRVDAENDANGFCMPQFQHRWQWRWFDIPAHLAATPMSAVRLEITSVMQPGDCMQLGHWHLKTGAPSNSNAAGSGSAAIASTAPGDGTVANAHAWMADVVTGIIGAVTSVVSAVSAALK